MYNIQSVVSCQHLIKNRNKLQNILICPNFKKRLFLNLIFTFKVEVERALVEAEQEFEVAALEREKNSLEALRNKIEELETKSQQEKEKVCYKHFLTLVQMRFRTLEDDSSITGNAGKEL